MLAATPRDVANPIAANGHHHASPQDATFYLLAAAPKPSRLGGLNTVEQNRYCRRHWSVSDIFDPVFSTVALTLNDGGFAAMQEPAGYFLG